MVAQAYALGATAVVSRPREIIPKLAQIEVEARKAKIDVAIISPGITDGSAAFATMFSQKAASRTLQNDVDTYARYTGAMLDVLMQIRHSFE
jgi:hypothetical protein